jgi:four helix bundle protein
MMQFEKLIVYQKAFETNEKIYAFIKANQQLPAYMRSQLGRAGLSILLNIVEGCGRLSGKDKIHFYVIARGSVFEVSALFRFLLKVEPNFKSTTDIDSLQNDLEAISKMLYALIKPTKFP